MYFILVFLSGIILISGKWCELTHNKSKVSTSSFAAASPNNPMIHFNTCKYN